MLCLLAVAVVGNLSASWYGPGTVTAPLSYRGDPYDPEVNDVRVEFVGRHGAKVERLAYFVGDGKFSSTLVAPAPGTYTARFFLNGTVAAELKDAVDVETKLPHGFIGVRGTRFAWTDGTPYFPIGYDYGWRGVPNETVAQGMTKMGKTGANWSRIWTSHWDSKNPFWPEKGQTIPGRELRQGPLQTWDDIVNAADKAGVSFQFVLFHHGPYSTTTDSNWRDHPWNTANGGFLKDPTDFFVDPEAKHRARIWLRYAVARYAHSPAIMAWELFNEVQWVDAIKKNPKRAGDVAAWHKEMIAYVKSLDPYHHLVTSSSSESLDSGIFKDVDYLQPHTYPANVLASISGFQFNGRPGFFGEFGPPGGPGVNYNRMVRDGIYGGMLAGHSGAGEYWFWDNVDRAKLGPTYSAARKVIDESGLLTHADAKPWPIWVETPKRTDLVVSAGGGWQKSTISELDLPKVDIRSLGGWSPYFQSLEGNNKAWASPLVIKFEAKEAGKLLVNVGQISTAGGTLTVWVNDKQVFDQKYNPPTPGQGFGGRRGGRPPVSVDYPAGPVVVRLENHGKDWIRVDSITVPNLGAGASGHGMGDRNWALIRVFGTDTSQVTVTGVGLRDGQYRARVFDAANGQTSDKQVEVKKGTFETSGLPPDAVLALSK
jgi:hypothetical protein